MTVDRRRFVEQAATLAALPLLDRWIGAGRDGTLLVGLERSFGAAPLRADGAWVNAALARFDAVGRTASGINRVAYSEGDLAGRAFTLDLYRAAGLTPRIDTAGNIVARVAGSDPRLPAIVIGSHVDSVTDGGNFDGPVGTFGAIGVARALQAQGVRLRHPIDVVCWQNEEGGTIGSKLAIGAPVDLDGVARSGKTIREGIALIGGDAARLAEVVRPRGSVACYLELHIEQGGNLDRSGTPIGVVLGIVGLKWFEVTIDGFANHAGATPMDQRQDAMLAAAKFTLAVNEAIRSEPGRQVATIGRVVALPNTRNVIAGQVQLTVDLRDLDAAKVARFAARFQQLGREIGAATNTTFSFREATSSEPAMADPRVMGWIEASAGALGLGTQRMPSGAGHDAQEMAHVCPMGMIFVPSVGGISHSPREFSRPQDIANGVDVLLNTVIAADRTLDA
ncbi:MAG: Zn-dependent hydrolase [Gemmatimonadota bacterium]|nr:Zn-dependent hydrolase [Gemmatimonadota bacterium]